MRASRPFTLHNRGKNGWGVEIVEWESACKSLEEKSDIKGIICPSISGARREDGRKPTSITTIPKEKMSASSVIAWVLSRISGAAHLAVYPCAGDTSVESTL